MSHVPHILASVFLCGLWLPVWFLIAISDNPQWHCAFCGFHDKPQYLANPNLRAAERQQAQAAAADRAQRREALAGTSFGDRAADFILTNKQAVIALGVGVVAVCVGVIVIGFVKLDQMQNEQRRIVAERSRATPTATATPTPSPTPRKRK